MTHELPRAPLAARLEALTLPLLLLGGAAWIAPLLAQPFAISMNDDWTQILAFQEYLRDQLLTHGALPERSHMLGSGFPLPGHPEYPILSPLSIPVLLLGTPLGIKVAVLLVVLAGIAGTWLLLRRTLGIGPLPAAFGAATVVTAGWTPAILASGNYPEIHFLLFPLLAWCVLEPRDRTPGLFDGRLLLGAGVATTMLLDGHLNAVACLIVLGLWAALRGGRAALRCAVFAGLTGVLAAYKLLPTLHLLRIEDRSIDTYALGPIEVSAWAPSELFGWSCRADGFALGPIPWLLAAGALVHWRRRWRLLVCLAVAALLWRGPDAPLDLFWLLSRLPVLRSMDAPSKYFVFFVGFFVVVLGAVALDGLAGRLRTPLGVAALLGTVLPLVVVGAPTLRGVFTAPDVPPERRAFVQVDTPTLESGFWTGPRDQRPDLYVYQRRGFGLVRWEDNFRLPVAGIPAWLLATDGTQRRNPAYRGEVWVEGSSGDAQLRELSANRVVATAHLAADGALVVNQRWDGGWTCRGGERVERDGRLAIRLTAGDHEVTCGYRSAPLRWGALISLLGWGLALGGLARRARRRRRGGLGHSGA